MFVVIVGNIYDNENLVNIDDNNEDDDDYDDEMMIIVMSVYPSHEIYFISGSLLSHGFSFQFCNLIDIRSVPVKTYSRNNLDTDILSLAGVMESGSKDTVSG